MSGGVPSARIRGMVEPGKVSNELRQLSTRIGNLGRSLHIVTVVGDYTVQSWDRVVLASSNLIITLPRAEQGRVVTIKSTAAGVITLTINTPLAGEIDGSSSTSIGGTAYESVTLICDGTDWWSI